jgi:hypothetical protein
MLITKPFRFKQSILVIALCLIAFIIIFSSLVSWDTPTTDFISSKSQLSDFNSNSRSKIWNDIDVVNVNLGGGVIMSELGNATARYFDNMI